MIVPERPPRLEPRTSCLCLRSASRRRRRRQADAAARTAMGDDGCGKRVLIVDDDADIRAALSAVLGDEGYEVETAVDGVDALDVLRDGRSTPCVILLDLMMPRM